jgi:hypothetical protein
MSRTRLILGLAALWMLAMTLRLYPQFKDAIRVDGRLTTVAAYLEDACGQRVGPAAATCLAESGETAQLLLRQEQARSVLAILAPLLIYICGWRPAQLLRARLRVRRRRPA